MIVIGIDPGLSGGIAFLGSQAARVFDLPTSPLQGGGSVTRQIDVEKLYALVFENASGESAVAVIEDLSAGGLRARPGEQQGSSAQTVGSQYRTRGEIETVLRLVGLKVYPVMAQRWKKLYGIQGKTDKDAITRALDTAKVLYPGLGDELARKKDHNRGEAVLIAHWGHKVRPWEIF